MPQITFAKNFLKHINPNLLGEKTVQRDRDSLSSALREEEPE